MTGLSIEAQMILNRGAASGPLLKLSEPLSFWGGFDPTDGRILDRSHPEAGRSITGTVLALPGTRGSAGTPGGVAEALRRGVGPVAILLLKADVNITIGAQVADHLYGTETPVMVLTAEDFAILRSGMKLTIGADGNISGADGTTADSDAGPAAPLPNALS